MAFTLPRFNLTARVWRDTNNVAAAPDVTSLCQLTPGIKTTVPIDSSGAFSNGSGMVSQIRFPKGTDIRGFNSGGLFIGDLIECPTGTGRFYWVIDVEDVAKGFANEYRVAFAVQLNAFLILSTGNPWLASIWPVPTP